MKKLVLASILSTAVGAGTVAATAGGPFHLAFTLPHSFYAETWVPNTPAPGSNITLGVTQFDYIMTDVVISAGGLFDRTTVLADGQPIAALPFGWTPSGNAVPASLHLNTGIRIPAGSTIALRVTTGSQPQTPVTITGYYQ